MTLKDENSSEQGMVLMVDEASAFLSNEKIGRTLGMAKIVEPRDIVVEVETVARRIANDPDDTLLGLGAMLSRDRWLVHECELADDAVIFTHVEHFLNAKAYMKRLNRVDIDGDIDIIFMPTLKNMKVCMPLLSGYRRAYLATDLNLCGLQFLDTLQDIAGDAIWLSPTDWTEFESLFTHHVESGELMAAIGIAERLGLKDELTLLRSTKQFCQFSFDYGEVNDA